MAALYFFVKIGKSVSVDLVRKGQKMVWVFNRLAREELGFDKFEA